MPPEIEAEVETPEPINERDAVNNAVVDAIAQLRGDHADEPDALAADDSQVDAPADKSKAEKPAGQRDPTAKERDPATGKFLGKTDKEAPVKAASEPKLASTDTQAKASVADPNQPAPPAGWTPDAKAEWSNLSPALKAAVIKRETEIANGGRQWSDEKRQYESVLAPVVELSSRYGVPPAEGLKRLVAANEFLMRDAPSAIAWLAQAHGVDLAALVSNPPAPQPQDRSDPLVPQLTQKISTLEGQLNGFLQNQTLGVVESFAKANEHYAAVENDLLQLIPMIQQTKPGLSPQEVLQEAYERAIWLNPEVRNRMITGQQTAAEQQRATTTQTKSAQAKKAAVSIKGSSNGVGATSKAPVPGKDVYEDVRNAIASLRN